MVQMECRIGSVKSYRQVNKNLKTNSSSISDKLVMRAKAMCRGDFPEEILRNNLEFKRGFGHKWSTEILCDKENKILSYRRKVTLIISVKNLMSISSLKRSLIIDGFLNFEIRLSNKSRNSEKGWKNTS